MTNKTFCPLPSNHLYIRPDGGTNVCCRFKYVDFFTSNKKYSGKYFPSDKEIIFHSDLVVPNINEVEDINDILSEQYYQDIRHSLNSGDRVTGCESCYIEEETGSHSMRKTEMADWGDSEYWKDKTPVVETMELTFGNYCNLACRTCNATLSSSWHEESLKLQHLYQNHSIVSNRTDVKREWKPEEFKNLKFIKITGGEPPLHPDFFKFLTAMIESGNAENIEVSLFTNASYIPKKKLINSLMKFKKVKIYLSIDGIGNVQEYIRHKSVWDTVQQSTHAWLQAEKSNTKNNMVICLAPTVNMYNILNITELFNWWIECRTNIVGNDDIGSIVSFNILSYPRYLSIDQLPNNETAIYKLREFIYNTNIDSTYKSHLVDFAKVIEERLISTADGNKEMLKKFITFTKDVDFMREQSVKEQIPELYEMLQKYFENIPGNFNK